MSRWIEQFENHPFHAVWEDLLTKLKPTNVDDQTVTTSVQELARLKKVITFIDKLINSIDPELVPSATWDNVNSQATACLQQISHYNSNRNIGHIQNANAHADNLITYVRPYMVAEGKAAKLMQVAAKEYAGVVSGYIESFKTNAGGLVDEIQAIKTEAEQSQTAIQSSFDAVEKLKVKLFGGEEVDGLEAKIDECANQAEQKFDEINSYHNETLVGDAKNPSTKKLLADVQAEILARQKEINAILTEVTSEVKDINGFHAKVFGKPNDEGILEGGLQKDFEDRIKKLADFEGKQIEKYNTLNAQIESLLPGATSAGLATAYKELKESFENPIKYSTYVFLASIGLLVFGSILLSIESIGGDRWIEFVKFDTLESVFKGLVHNLPYYAPVIWLAIVASKRRSEYQRLQQEYAHKEALAKSYDSYKKQLESLDDKDKSMQKELIKKAVDAIAFNASQTLDGQHGDNHPAQDLLRKVYDILTDIKSTVIPPKA
jgi:hypothetical protein